LETQTQTQIQAFNFEGTDVRTHIDAQETIWWVLADVCAVLEISKHRDLAASLDPDQRAYMKTDTLGGPQKMTTINESGLWTVIMRCVFAALLRYTHGREPSRA